MRLKVLIVEDDPIQADVLARLLGSHGYYVEISADGRCALRRLRTGAFHVALIDYRLPEIDGLGLARVVRTLDAFARPRLVALTSSPQDLAADAADFDEILRKPISLEPLLQAIERGRAESAQTGAATGASPRGPAGSGRRVLLAEDDADLRELLRQTLESRGFDVEVAADGLEAVARIGESAYDVVVLDFKMPKLDGLAAAKIIYDLIDRRTRPRIVALTSTPAGLIAEDPRWHLVFDDVVSKASGLPAMLSAIENCLTYKAIRSQKPLQVVDLQSMMALARAG